MEALDQLSEREVQKLNYDDKKLLKQLIKDLPLQTLTDILGSKTISRLDLVTVKQMNSEDICSPLNETVKSLTPRETKKLLIYQLQQFTVNVQTQEMLEEEATELSLSQLKKLIELTKSAFSKKAKDSFKQAQREFLKVLEIDSHNKAAQLHVKRCLLFETDSPPDETWDGVWKLTEK